MFGKFSYMAYMLIFTVIPIIFLWWRRFNLLKNNFKIILINILVGIAYAFFVDTIAVKLGIWYFSSEKILGLYLFNLPIEEVIWTILVAFVISSAIIFFIDSLKQGSLSKIFKVYRK